MQGRIFNIQRFSINDGPGIRTTVFLKGCNLRCLWCHNPESNLFEQEIQYFPQKCVKCVKCVEVCPNQAHSIVRDVHTYDRTRCKLAGECVQNCMYDALEFVYKCMEPAEVVEIVMKDADYYRDSGGGLTISGGEPLLQADFVREVFAMTRINGIHNALDTAANVPWEILAKVLPYTDLVLLDLKAIDDGLHRKGTGVSNKRILENAARLAQEDVEIIVRIPVVPGINASQENMLQTAQFVKQLPNLRHVDLLQYHDLGVDKFNSLGKAELAYNFETPTAEQMIALAAPFEQLKVPINIP
jgi:glycyl-radical enzyme activating protein